MLSALALTGLTLFASPRGLDPSSESYLVRAVVCSALRGSRLFVTSAEGASTRLRFRSRAECLTARRRLEPTLNYARRRGGAVFVTPIFDDRARVIDVGLPEVKP